ncbi:MAG TPA: DUF3108 domain-containing protein [Amaricoccus sp.]|nr:DUF3108 domain-containing protein [Amaricoccus sp.]
MSRLARLLALGSLLALPSLATADQASFSFSVAGIRVGAMTMATEQSAAGYSATSRIDTAGLAGLFDFFFDGKATGSVAGNGTVVPADYTAVSKSPRALRHTKIAWRQGVPVSVSVEPPRKSAPDPAKQGGTLDPVSAGFRLFRTAPADEVCATTVDVFDGSRRSRLQVAKPTRDGEALVCAGTFARIEGEAHSMADLQEFPFRLVFLPSDGGLYRLERIEAPTNFGQAVLARTG